MKIEDLRALLKNKKVIEEINKHLWIESQKAGYSIGIERATDEWLRLYAMGWMRYNMPEQYGKAMKKKPKETKAAITKKKEAKTTPKKVVKKEIKKVVKKVVKKTEKKSSKKK